MSGEDQLESMVAFKDLPVLEELLENKAEFKNLPVYYSGLSLELGKPGKSIQGHCKYVDGEIILINDTCRKNEGGKPCISLNA